MSDTAVIQIALQAITIAVKLAAPILLVTLVIGLFISLIQSATQVQEVTLTFVPKLAGVALVLLLAGNWMMGEMVGYTRQLFDLLPQLLES
ncbi:MAG: flagellar biosynthetic protein FliQ [Acidimicrobiia bacterium]|nr:flagellar biosynthetic protein FliQ [Acidimicrobiia bacterium]